MKTHALLAIILIAIGIVAFIYQGLTDPTTDKVVDLGSIQMTTEKTRTIPLGPVIGGIAFLAGIVLLARGGANSVQQFTITRRPL